jgi:hypothetical protein
MAYHVRNIGNGVRNINNGVGNMDNGVGNTHIWNNVLYKEAIKTLKKLLRRPEQLFLFRN